MAYLCESVGDVLKYYRYKLRQEPVTRLYVAGKLDAAGQVCDVLNRHIDLPVEIWDPLTQVTVNNARLAQRLADGKNSGALLATSLGLALRKD